MIASRESTAETMLRALSHSIGALDAASELDVDRSAEDRAFFAAEKATLQTSFDEVFSVDQSLASPDAPSDRPTISLVATLAM